MSNEIQNKNINLKQWADGNEPPFNPEMEVEIKDFVGVFKKAFTKEWCDQTIKYFAIVTGFGVIIGTYSSIFVSTYLLILFKVKKMTPKIDNTKENPMHYAG